MGQAFSVLKLRIKKLITFIILKLEIMFIIFIKGMKNFIIVIIAYFIVEINLKLVAQICLG